MKRLPMTMVRPIEAPGVSRAHINRLVPVRVDHVLPVYPYYTAIYVSRSYHDST